MQCIETEPIHDMYYIGLGQHQCYLYNLFRNCLSGAVGSVGRSLGVVVEVLGSNFARGEIFTSSIGSVELLYLYVQWATLVTHHFFRAHIFWQKCWNRTFSMIIYLLTFYLFDNIENFLLESLMRTILLLKGNFDKFWKMRVQAERLYFLFLFCARHD